ncbi:MAG: hydroxyectoine utilization dehydratase EutB [Chloroflexi bacterium]|nr:MAG: hydroxyectoine utilization dehydratase EutB [Chloroflexota bacterium]
MPNLPVTLRDLYLARQRIMPYVRRTPLAHTAALSARAGAHVYLKLENLQETGAFKLRGAANRLLNLSPAERQRGVVTVSTGNHGRGVAYIAQQLGVRAVVCVPNQVLPHKIAAMRQLGAEIIVHGQTQDEAEAHALQLQAEQGLTLVSAFDDPLIIAGQGTIGVELLEELPQIDTAIIPLSGGGLLSGIALALKTADPAIRIVGVSQERQPAMYLSLQAGRPVPVIEEPTLADSLVGSIGLENRYTFTMVQALVDEVVLVSEEEIAAGMVYALHEEHQVVEGGAAVGIAALLSGKVQEGGRTVAIVVSGGNVDVGRLIALAAA